jgi:hypothetical protein
MNITFDKKTITSALGITARELEYLIEESIVPMGEFGEYDINACITAYSKYQTRLSGGTSVIDKRIMDEIIFEMADKIARFRTKMLEIPYRVAGLCSRLKDTSEVERFMRELIEEALAELTPLECIKSTR